jgi:signal transduction histidine kinase
LLLDGETDPERRRDLAVIHTQAMRVVEMISDLMLFARPPQPQRASCDLAALVERVAQEMGKLAEERQCTIATLFETKPIVASVDERQFTVAIRAICVNALEAMKPGGSVELAVRREENTVVISVTDNGPGITPDVRRHLFDPFFSGRSAGRGLGTGLAKCWRIVTNHGGRIDVDDAPGGGARFTIVLDQP